MKTPSRPHIFDFNAETLAAWCQAQGWPAFRAGQILEWVYQRSVIDPHAMTNLAKRDRQTLAESIDWLDARVIAHQRASDDTQKLLLQWSEPGEGAAERAASNDPLRGTLLAPPDAPNAAATAGAARTAVQPRVLGFDYDAGDPKRQTECVIIPASSSVSEKPRRTACISSQVGCPVGCRFCASGLGGLDGNLTSGRIVEQAWRLDALLRAEAVRRSGPDASGKRQLTNIVFMGMGEPLANFRNVVNAVRTLAAPWGMGISARRITVSTVGMHKAIERLADELEVPVTLALSLHAPNDDIRRSLIPWAQYTSIEQLFAACDAWFRKTGREITLEYTLLQGVNDRPEHARELAAVAHRLRANVNLIRWNEVGGLPFHRPIASDVHRFQEILKSKKVNTHIRASRGRDIAAACGQLRHEHRASSTTTGLTVKGQSPDHA